MPLCHYADNAEPSHRRPPMRRYARAARRRRWERCGANALSRFSDVIFESRSCQTYVVRTPPVVFVLKPEISLRSNPLHVVLCEDSIVRDNGQRFDLRLRDQQPVKRIPMMRWQ